MELFKMARFEFTIDLIPALIKASASAYATSLLEDNCGWVIYGWQLLGIRTAYSMSFVKCGFNLKTLILEA